jgi:hypothetical protein
VEKNTGKIRVCIVTPRVMKSLIKSLKLQLSLKARANQVIKVRSSNSKFQVRFSVDRFTQSGNSENLLELN